jgi:hypothetical protein
MSSPSLVVEVVSPKQDKRDYRYKRSAYAARQIPEYWIVDPILNKVTVLELVEGLLFNSPIRFDFKRLPDLTNSRDICLDYAAHLYFHPIPFGKLTHQFVFFATIGS